MRRSMVINQSLRVKAGYKNLSVNDAFVSIASLPIGFLLSNLAYSFLSVFVTILVPLLTVYLLMPSKDIWGKKNYEAYYIVLTSDNNVYRAL